MLEFLIDNIFAMFGGHVFQQSAFLWVITVPPSHRRQTSTGASEETIYNILYITFYSSKIPLFQIYSYYPYNFIKGFNLVQFLEMS